MALISLTGTHPFASHRIHHLWCLVDTSVDGAEFTKRLTESLGDGECECHTDIGPQLDPWVSFPPTLLGAHSRPASPTPPPQLPVTARECSSQSSTYRVCK